MTITCRQLIIKRLGMPLVLRALRCNNLICSLEILNWRIGNWERRSSNMGRSQCVYKFDSLHLCVLYEQLGTRRTGHVNDVRVLIPIHSGQNLLNWLKEIEFDEGCSGLQVLILTSRNMMLKPDHTRSKRWTSILKNQSLHWLKWMLVL